MAYETSNPPMNLTCRIGDGATVWVYRSADAAAAVTAADYFANGDDLGMKVGDVVLVSDTATPAGTTHVVSAVTAGGAATVV